MASALSVCRVLAGRSNQGSLRIATRSRSFSSKYSPSRFQVFTSRSLRFVSPITILTPRSVNEVQRLFSSSSSSSSSQSSSKLGKSEGFDSPNSNENSSIDEPSTAASPSPSVVAESSSAAASESPEGAALTGAARYRRAVAEYGVVVPVFHVTLALTSLGFFYALVSAGVDFDALFAFFGVDSSRFAAGVSTFALAYAVHKLFAPLRIGITLSVAPFLVKWMRMNVTPSVVKWVNGAKALLRKN